MYLAMMSTYAGLPLLPAAVRDWGYLVVLYVFVQLSRVLLLLVLYPGLRYSGYGLDWKESVVLVWAGLRGAVALALSLLVSVSTSTPKLLFSCTVDQ